MAKLPKPFNLPSAILWKDEMNDIAHRVGFFFITWSLLEETIRDLYGYAVLRGSWEPHHAARIASPVSRGTQVDTILSVMASEAKDEPWATELTASLAKIKASAEERNKLAHQLWMEDPEGNVVRAERTRNRFRKKGDEYVATAATVVALEKLEEELSKVYDLHLELERHGLPLMEWAFDHTVPRD